MVISAIVIYLVISYLSRHTSIEKGREVEDPVAL
jgi:hypothetical protein